MDKFEFSTKDFLYFNEYGNHCFYGIKNLYIDYISLKTIFLRSERTNKCIELEKTGSFTQPTYINFDFPIYLYFMKRNTLIDNIKNKPINDIDIRSIDVLIKEIENLPVCDLTPHKE